MTLYKIVKALKTMFDALKPYVAACIWAVLGAFSPIMWVSVVLTFGSVVHFGSLLTALALRYLEPAATEEREEDEAPAITGGGINSSIAAQHAMAHPVH